MTMLAMSLCMFVFSIVAINKELRWFLLNPQYALWVYNLYTPDDEIIYRGLVGDINSNSIFRGKLIHSVKRKLKNLQRIETSEIVKLGFPEGSEVYQWSNYPWFVLVDNGVIVDLRMIKG